MRIYTAIHPLTGIVLSSTSAEDVASLVGISGTALRKRFERVGDVLSDVNGYVVGRAALDRIKGRGGFNMKYEQ